MLLLITGVAGFIGFHLAQARLKLGDKVIGIDNLNDYYDVRLKKARLNQLLGQKGFTFYQEDLCQQEKIAAIFAQHKPQQVLHLAGQAGVRYSITHPDAYVQSNLLGFSHLIELCRQQAIEHFIYASSSSVYGANEVLPYSEEQDTSRPLSFYAATKKANELMAHSYSHLFQLPTTGLRFFTVYGPWGRPDMAFFSFTRDILSEKPIKLFNHGQMIRDFTYIDDIIQGISLILEKTNRKSLYRIYNIGCGKPVALLDYIEALERALSKKAKKEFLPMQAGEVVATHADTRLLTEEYGYVPQTDIEEGVERFIKWYKSFYSVGADSFCGT